MPNIIEIRVQALNEVGAGLDAAKSDARAAGEQIASALGGTGAQAGDEFASAFAERVDEQAAVTAEDWASYAEMFGAPGVEAGTAFAEGVAAGVEVIEETIEQQVDVVLDMVKAKVLSAEQAVAVLAGQEPKTSGFTDQLGAQRLTGTWASASAALKDYGAEEANVAITTAMLAEAQDELLGSQTALVQMSQMMAEGSEFSAEVQAKTFAAVAEAQRGLTVATMTQVAAQTQLTAAVLREESALEDETTAMQALASAATSMGVSIDDLTQQIDLGETATLNLAAADARAELQAQQLADAQLQLAAANITLVDTYARLAAGEEVSADAQRAALAGVSSAQRGVEQLGGSVGALAKDTEQASGHMSGLANVMYGPAGMAVFGLMAVLPLLSGMFSQNAVTASAFTSAVQQDSNAVGDNTAATIQQILAKSDLADISRTLGLSQAQLIEYAAGEANVQAAVTAAYNAKQAALGSTKDTEQVHSKAQLEGATSAQLQSQALAGQKATLDQVTSAVQAAIVQDKAQSDALLAAEQTTQIYNAAVDALGSKMLLQVESTQMSNEATARYGAQILAAESTQQFMNAAVAAAGVNMELQAHATDIANEATAQYGYQVIAMHEQLTSMNAALDASQVSMLEQAQTSAQASVGLLGLGDAQSQVNYQLVDAEEQYTASTTQANAYAAALTALSGTTNTLLGAEAAFTTSLGQLDTAVKSNGTSLDVTTTKGAANVTMFTQVATAADKAAAAVYQHEVNTEGATKAYDDANAKLLAEKDAFEQAAEKAGFNKTAVQQLADELYQLPSNIDIGMNVDTEKAKKGVKGLIEWIDAQSGAVTVFENSAGQVWSPGSGASRAQAVGGPSSAAAVGGGRSGWTQVDEQGPELMNMPNGTLVMPHANREALAAAGALGGGGRGGGSVEIRFGGNTDGAFASAFMALVRNGDITILKKAIV